MSVQQQSDEAVLELARRLRDRFEAPSDLILIAVDADDGQAFVNMIHAAASIGIDAQA